MILNTLPMASALARPAFTCSAKVFFIVLLRLEVGFGVARARPDLAPAVAVEHAVDHRRVGFAPGLRLVSLADGVGFDNEAGAGFVAESVEQVFFLSQRQVLPAAVACVLTGEECVVAAAEPGGLDVPDVSGAVANGLGDLGGLQFQGQAHEDALDVAEVSGILGLTHKPLEAGQCVWRDGFEFLGHG
jgi:hypothetical protein